MPDFESLSQLAATTKLSITIPIQRECILDYGKSDRCSNVPMSPASHHYLLLPGSKLQLLLPWETDSKAVTKFCRTLAKGADASYRFERVAIVRILDRESKLVVEFAGETCSAISLRFDAFTDDHIFLLLSCAPKRDKVEPSAAKTTYST